MATGVGREGAVNPFLPTAFLGLGGAEGEKREWESWPGTAPGACWDWLVGCGWAEEEEEEGVPLVGQMVRGSQCWQGQLKGEHALLPSGGGGAGGSISL